MGIPGSHTGQQERGSWGMNPPTCINHWLRLLPNTAAPVRYSCRYWQLEGAHRPPERSAPRTTARLTGPLQLPLCRRVCHLHFEDAAQSGKATCPGYNSSRI